MREIEAKILEVNRKELEARLKEVGARKIADRKIFALFFDFSDRRLKKEKAILRLRKDDEGAFLCVKKKTRKGRFKDLDEFEVKVSDFDETIKIISSLGFVETKMIEKKRISYLLEGIGIEIDEIEGIPPFAEIEAPSEKEIVDVAKKLGFSEKQLLPWSTFDILKHYKKK